MQWMGKGLTAACLVACAAPAAAVAGARAPALEDFGNLPTLEQVALSPNAQRLAYIAREGDVRRLVVQATTLNSDHSMKLDGLVDLGSAKLRGLAWAGSDDLLITTSAALKITDLSAPMQEWSSVLVYDVAHKRMQPLMPETDGALNAVLGAPQVLRIGGRPAVFFEAYSFPDERGVVTLYRSDLDGAAPKRVAVGSPQTRAFVVDGQGALLARSDYDQHSGRLTVSFRSGNAWTPRYQEVSPIDASVVLGRGRNGRSVLLVSADPGSSTPKLRELSADGTLSPSLTPGIIDTAVDPVTGVLIGGRRSGESRSDYVFFDPVDQKRWNAVVRAFQGEDVTLVSSSDDRMKLVVHVTGVEHGDAYYRVDLATGGATWFGDRYAGIASDQVAEVRVIHYAAQDGLDIPAYLTLPRGRASKDLPLIVLPHGGPAGRDFPGFDWWSQALASRGYAVLQPQFRGSAGLDADRLAAGYGQWGRKMQTDLSDGVRALAKQALVDPKRVCIVGAGYGGYAALAGATLDPGVYRCAASLGGMSDLRRFLSYEAERYAGRDNAPLRAWDRSLGVARSDDPRLDTVSPARLADRVAVPILLMHGEGDTVVPFEQSRLMEQALRKAGKPVRLVALKGEDHWLSRSETRLQMLKTLVEFLETNNPPQ